MCMASVWIRKDTGEENVLEDVGNFNKLVGSYLI